MYYVFFYDTIVFVGSIDECREYIASIFYESERNAHKIVKKHDRKKAIELYEKYFGRYEE